MWILVLAGPKLQYQRFRGLVSILEAAPVRPKHHPLQACHCNLRELLDSLPVFHPEDNRCISNDRFFRGERLVAIPVPPSKGALNQAQWPVLPPVQRSFEINELQHFPAGFWARIQRCLQNSPPLAMVLQHRLEPNAQDQSASNLSVASQFAVRHDCAETAWLNSKTRKYRQYAFNVYQITCTVVLSLFPAVRLQGQHHFLLGLASFSQLHPVCLISWLDFPKSAQKGVEEKNIIT